MGEVLRHKKHQPFREHVRELRQTVTWSLLYVLLGSVLGYALYKPLFAILIKPYHNQLYYTTVAGAFNAIFKVSILFGIIVAIPFIAYRLYKFVSPALPLGVQFFTAKLIGLSFLFATAGVCYGYFLSLPATIHFLTTVGPVGVNPLVEVSGYLNFVFHYLIGMALVFQFPLILLIINKVKPLKPGGLMKYQRHAIAASTVIAAVITPTTDPINMALMMVPVIALYQIGVIFIWLANRNRQIILVQKVRPDNVPAVTITPIPLNFGLSSTPVVQVAPAMALSSAPASMQKTAMAVPAQVKTIKIKPVDDSAKIDIKIRSKKTQIMNQLASYTPQKLVSA